MFYHRILLSLATFIAGTVNSIQADQQKKFHSTTAERVGVLPEREVENQASKKNKHTKMTAAALAVVPESPPTQQASERVAIVPEKEAPSRKNSIKKKKKRAKKEESAQVIHFSQPSTPSVAIVPEKSGQQPNRVLFVQPHERRFSGPANPGVVPANPGVAIVPNATNQAVPCPAAYPAPVVNVVQVPQRPIVISKPLPQAVVINQRSAAYPYATLAPYAISAKGDFIQLEDGSQWKVRHRHYGAVRHWKKGDAIMIETGKFFTWSAYKLVNYTRNEFVDVELIEPVHSGTLSHWINEINFYEGYLRLQDGSIWRMSTNELLNWRVNDEVMVAITKDWFSNYYSYILINPRAKNRLIAIFSY